MLSLDESIFGPTQLMLMMLGCAVSVEADSADAISINFRVRAHTIHRMLGSSDADDVWAVMNYWDNPADAHDAWVSGEGIVAACGWPS